MRISAATSVSPRAGYTLAELIVVLVIIGLALAVVAPRLFSTSDAGTMRSAVAMLDNAARTARTSARLAGRETVLVVDVDARIARIEPGGETIDLPDTLAIEATVAESELDGALAGVRFFPEGGSTGGTYRLTAGDAALNLRIDWITGLAARELPDDET
ncbi:GspH/FimT family pseudopilin [Hyphobacterium marinum]|uniref:GspH/FimT family pseudopilin n=1 Tax=Hyphobacterium marinum TaxID=3116574 RepID=A0ABU7LXJ8_9PROT|nr:GspH/FimT family pseudopilin [Hyphobacterium sp. Y6023]MEE2565725.1 GspH/FimT family pseudopilin [Hyphobacterium sp. Y6023]